MPTIQCLFLSVKPVADVRLTFKSKGEDYPPHIPHHVTKVLELHFVSPFLDQLLLKKYLLTNKRNKF